MSEPWIAPEYELYPDRRRWTVQECHELADSGRLVGRYEVLDGEPVSKMGQKPSHAMTLTRLMAVMVRLFGPNYLRIQTPLTLRQPDSVYTEPETDIVVTKGPEETYAGRHPGPDDIILVAEISDATLRTDLLVKSRLYARSHIPEYWIIDLPGRRVHVQTDPMDGEYATVKLYSEAESVPGVAHLQIPIPVTDVLPPPTI